MIRRTDVIWFILGILGTLLIALYCYFLITAVYTWVQENTENTTAATIYALAFSLLGLILCAILLFINTQVLTGWNLLNIVRVLYFGFHSLWIIALTSTAAYLWVTDGLFNPAGVLALLTTILLSLIAAHYCTRSITALKNTAK